ncbi:MAG: tRNA (N(6)-L-threonylcarbamoyladenosine(37)-C(2))-methylthiotransferase MtaB [Candidatus Omnitrophota bacterium]
MYNYYPINHIMKLTTISFFTLGCRVNQAETAVLQNLFAREGFKVVDFDNPAQIVVINTCTVTAKGDADTRKMVNRITRKFPQARIALIGCQAQLQGEQLARLKNVRWVVGTAAKMNLLEILKEKSLGRCARVVIPLIKREQFSLPPVGRDRQHTRANLKIQDGCDFFCSYCEVPYARGRARSRFYDDVMQAGRDFADAGHREIVLTGINVGMYRDGASRLLDVLLGLESVPGIQRLRISSIELKTFSNRILKRMFPAGKLCRYLHVPLQSGDDAILRLMTRRYSSADFAGWLQKAREQVDDLCVGTDVIVGFPGETRSRFDVTYAFLEKQPLQYFHVFSYSQRRNAKSKDLGDTVPAEEIQRRSAVLRELSRIKRRTYYESLAGKITEVLFEEKKKGGWTGLSDHYVRVQVKTDQDIGNRLLPVKLVHPYDQFMTGLIVE